MALFNKVNCIFYVKENNSNFKCDEFECTVVCQSGSVSFVIYEIGLQFLIDEQAFNKVILDNKSIEVDGVYIDFTAKNIFPVKCKIKIDITTGIVGFCILNLHNIVQIKTESLMKILDIK